MNHRHTVALTVMLLFAAPVCAQTPTAGPPPTGGRTNGARIRQQDMSRREGQLRSFGLPPGAPKDKRQIEALMAQTEEDFNRILTLHNDIARAIKSNDSLNHHFVFEATGEIKKRASRVQSTLALGLSTEEARETPKPEEFKDSEIKGGLIKLCQQIRSFVTNPTIENPNTVDAEQLTRARYDLEKLIQMSGQINKLSKGQK